MRLLYGIVAVLCASAAAGDSLVEVLTDANFDAKIQSEGLPWFVGFFAPWCGHCREMKPTWEKASVAMKDKLRFGSVDSTVNQHTRESHGVTGFPTLLLFKNGEQREEYIGERTISDFEKYYNDKVANMGPRPKSNITSYEEDTFDEAIEQGVTAVFFFAPWCGHCKAFQNTWESVGHLMARGTKGLKAGKVDAIANAELRKQFGVSAFPTILGFKDGRLRGEFTRKEDKSSTWHEAQQIVAWAEGLLEPAAQEFDGDLATITQELVNFVLLPDGDDATLEMFMKVAEIHTRGERVQFLIDTADEYPQAKVLCASQNKSFEYNGKLDFKSLNGWVKASKRPWFWHLIPNKNINDFMYDGEHYAVQVFANLSDTESQEYVTMFKEVAWEMRDSPMYNFGVLDVHKHPNIAKQVGIFPSNVPNFIVFDGRMRHYFSDRYMEKTPSAIKAFLYKTKSGQAPAKKPGSEKEGPPPVKNAKKASEKAKPSDSKPKTDDGKAEPKEKLKGVLPGIGGDAISRIEDLMEQLLAAQKRISNSIVELHEEMYDLRSDIMIIGDPENYPKPEAP